MNANLEQNKIITIAYLITVINLPMKFFLLRYFTKISQFSALALVLSGTVNLDLSTFSKV